MRTIAWLAASLSPFCAVAKPFARDVNQQTLTGDVTFDYVVVGGGTGGLAVAYRLAEDGSKSVAVVEAGGFYEEENGNTSVVPAYNQAYNNISSDSQWDMPLVDWGFLTTPQVGAQNQIFHYGRGKMLGGCSAQNAMNYNRPTIGTMQAWADAVNDSSYTWNHFFPYFVQSVNYTEPDTSIRAANATVPALSSREIGGPLQVSFPHWATPFASWAQLAFREIGVQDVHDMVSGELLGSQYNALTINPDDQTRSSSESSFLRRAVQSNRTNLAVFTHTLAKRVVLDDKKRATGVEVQSKGMSKFYTLSARNEVVVSAGAFQSPQLLMVSGIGPSALLKSHNIDVIADLPGVGQNMWDHVVLSVGHQVDVETYGRLMNSTIASAVEYEYNTNHTGILTNDMSDYLGWEKVPAPLRSGFSNSTLTDLSHFPTDWPELEYEVSSAPFGTPAFSTPQKPIDVGYIQPILIAPLSRGNISISSANTADPPLINPNWLTHHTDQEVAVAAFKRARQFFHTPALTPILIGDELLPGPTDLPYNSTDAEILTYIQQNIGFNWHAACTCKMGTKDDPMAVVDSTAKVFGVHGLRVVDASAFPLLPPGHPQATVYALAEKIAADILAGR